MPGRFGLDRDLIRRGRIVDSPGSWVGKPWGRIRSHPAQHWFHGSRSACRAVWIDLGKVDKMGRTNGQMQRRVFGKTNELHEPEWLPPLVMLGDMALPLGHLRLRTRGGSGGHNGLESVIMQFGTEEIPRLRIGIGEAPPAGSVDYVLSRFFEEEKPIVRSTIDRAVEAVKCAIDNDLISAMNIFNKTEEP